MSQFDSEITAKAIIYDLFGTLVFLGRDSRPYHALARTCRSPSLLRDSLVVRAETLSHFCMHQGVAPPANIKDLERQLKQDVETVELFSDALASLRKAKKLGLRIGLVSNLATPYVHCFRRLNLAGYFDATVFSCDVGCAKPDAEIYKLALDELSVQAHEAIMIGDSQRADVDGPVACGIRAILLDRSNTRSGALRTLDDLENVFSNPQ